jgi:ABC-2 type transport system permease protein
MERRHTRRLVRYWVFIGLVYFLGIGAFLYYSVLHALFSSWTASIGLVGPRYMISAIGLYYLLAFVFTIVFLGFDVRARDVRESIVEVLDSRPVTNLELLAGRFLALFLSGWIPIVALVLIIQGLGLLLPLLGSPIGRPVQPVSLVSFATFMAIPAVVFAVGLVFFITLLVRNRLVAALVAIGAIVGIYWVMFSVDGPYIPYADLTGIGQVTWPTDIVTTVSAPGGWIQRFGVLVIGLGLLGIAAVIHPRLDGRAKLMPAAISVALLVVGGVALGVVSQMRFGEAEQIETWRNAHAARAGEPVVDIVALEGSVAIEPGRRLDADLDLTVAAPQGQALDRVLLTLNPGFEIAGVATEDGRALEATHADGLLDIALERPLAPGETLTLELRYGGNPNRFFGYLDSAIELERLNMNEAQIGLLGYERAIFDRRYIALMPAIRWLPASGVDFGRDDPRTRLPDFVQVALEVTLPEGWLAAGPGRREALGGAGENARFRFAPAVAIPEVALVAGRLESYATEIQGITFEVLVDPAHNVNFTVLADSRRDVEQWISDRLDLARDAGLEYPFDAFTLVEVPTTLRSFEGGWRMDTALAPPSMMLLRETSFPTARFDFDVLNSFGNERDYDQEGGKPRIERDRVIAFFWNDVTGGNVFTAAARNFFAHRTQAFGENAIALDFALEEMTTLLISGQRSYFSAHLFTDVNRAAESIADALAGQGAVNSVSDGVIAAQTRRIDVWETALTSSLAEIDPSTDPQRAIDILTLKGGRMAEALYDTLGAAAVGRLLAQVLANHAGTTYSLEDVITASESVIPDLGPLVTDWFEGAGLPGFIAESAEIYRLPDGPNGNARYQTLLRIRNDEPVVGFARVLWTMERGGERSRSDPFRIPANAAVEFGVVLSEPPATVYVEPYVSQNRETFLAGLLDVGTIETRNEEPFEGVRASERPRVIDDRIIVDDLDTGFTINEGEQGGDNLRLAGRGVAAADTLDAGLPVASGFGVPKRWTRATAENSFGHYRHTVAYIGAGEGENSGALTTTLPSSGQWELEMHIPFLNFLPAEQRGTWNLEIVSADGRESVSYDATVGVVGWNLIGGYRLPAGEVSVIFSDRTDGRMVVADAIAWSPVGRPAAGSGASE